MHCLTKGDRTLGTMLGRLLPVFLTCLFASSAFAEGRGFYAEDRSTCPTIAHSLESRQLSLTRTGISSEVFSLGSHSAVEKLYRLSTADNLPLEISRNTPLQIRLAHSPGAQAVLVPVIFIGLQNERPEFLAAEAERLSFPDSNPAEPGERFSDLPFALVGTSYFKYVLPTAHNCQPIVFVCAESCPTFFGNDKQWFLDTARRLRQENEARVNDHQHRDNAHNSRKEGPRQSPKREAAANGGKTGQTTVGGAPAKAGKPDVTIQVRVYALKPPGGRTANLEGLQLRAGVCDTAFNGPSYSLTKGVADNVNVENSGGINFKDVCIEFIHGTQRKCLAVPYGRRRDYSIRLPELGGKDEGCSPSAQQANEWAPQGR